MSPRIAPFLAMLGLAACQGAPVHEALAAGEGDRCAALAAGTEAEEPAIAEGAAEVATAEAPFETLCPFEWTTGFVASLERALTVRGYFDGPVDGAWDGDLAEAVRAAQAPLGLDSPVLSLEAAQALGLARLSAGQLRAL